MDYCDLHVTNWRQNCFAQVRSGIPRPVFIVYHIINFHHYVVDAIVWRSAQVKLALKAS